MPQQYWFHALSERLVLKGFETFLSQQRMNTTHENFIGFFHNIDDGKYVLMPVAKFCGMAFNVNQVALPDLCKPFLNVSLGWGPDSGLARGASQHLRRDNKFIAKCKKFTEFSQKLGLNLI